MYWYALLLFVANINLYFIIFDSFEKKKHTRISLTYYLSLADIV